MTAPLPRAGSPATPPPAAPAAAAPSGLEIAAAVRGGARTATDVVEETFARIRALDPGLGCFEAVLEDRARGDARRVDDRLERGQDPGPLAGVPFAVKSLFHVAGIPTTAGSRIEPDRPAPRADATAVARLARAGAVLVGTTVMDEYAHGLTTENAHFGTTRNPHDRERIAGGSSGGSAAAVAAGLVPLALGSDTNGSVRVPASLCGVLGLKPTYGHVPRTGTVLFVTSMDHVGAFARTTADLAAAHDVLQGHDPADPVSLDVPARPCGPLLDRGTRGLRVAVAGDHFLRVLDDDAAGALERVASALDARREVVVAESARACAAAHVLTAVEGAQRHARTLRTRAGDLDPKVRTGLLAGALLPAGPYVAAQRFRRQYREEVRRALAEADVLLTATTPIAAPAIGQRTMTVAGETLPVGMGLGLLTQPWALVGLPALSVPVRRPGRLPLGVQLVAAPGAEAVLLRTAAALERAGVAGPAAGSAAP